MKKRCFSSLLLAVSFLLLPPLAAHADLIVEPNNDFYTRHKGECVSLNRSFYANGESGSVSLKKEPESKVETALLENGDEIYIMFTYKHNGEVWGVTQIYYEGTTPDKWTNGWVHMNQLLLKYDYISFEEEHQSEFYDYTGEYSILYETDDIVFWTWPGSGEKAWILENEWRNPETDGNFLKASRFYKDADGREWGFFVYVYGNRNSWVCLSDPGNTEISAFNPPPQPELWQSDNTSTSTNGLDIPVLVIVLVAVLVIGTAVLIRIFWKPNKGDL